MREAKRKSLVVEGCWKWHRIRLLSTRETYRRCHSISESEDLFIDFPVGDSPLRDFDYRLEHRLIKKLYHRQVDSLNFKSLKNSFRGANAMTFLNAR